MQRITIQNLSRSNVLGTRIELADTFRARSVGLLGRRGLDDGCGLLIRPCSGVHTFGMRFPIDVVALDRRRRVHALWRLRPWRLSAVSFRVHSVLELPAGAIERCGIQRGDQLAIVPSSADPELPPASWPTIDGGVLNGRQHRLR